MENKSKKEKDNITKSAIVGNVRNAGNFGKDNKTNQMNIKNSLSVNNSQKSEIENFTNNLKNDNVNKNNLVNSHSISNSFGNKINMENIKNQKFEKSENKEENLGTEMQCETNFSIIEEKNKTESSEYTQEDINQIKSSSSEQAINYLNFNTEEINSLYEINLNRPYQEKITESRTQNFLPYQNRNENINQPYEKFGNFQMNPQNNLQNVFRQSLINRDIEKTSSNSDKYNVNNQEKNQDKFENININEILNYPKNFNINNFNNQSDTNYNEFPFAKDSILTSLLPSNSYPSSENQNKAEPRSLLEDINIFNKFEEDKLKKSSVISDDYLQPVMYNLQNHRSIEEEFHKIFSIYDDIKDFINLQKAIESVTLEKESNNKNIGPISTLDFLIETSFKSDNNRKISIIENLISLEDTIFRWRKIGGDGNCFYRAVIFAYFEKIIFDRDLNLLRFHIIDFHNSLKDEIFMKKMKGHNIKTELVLKIFIILQNTLNCKEFSLISEFIDENLSNQNYSSNSEKINHSIQTTYDFFLRCFNSCKHFDLGLVMYFRYKLFQYIKKNEKKLYTKNFSVAIGNLLPSEYETESGNFLFEKFYEDFLLKLYKDAEKIVIYLTPFVLNLNLNILAFDFYKNSVEKVKEFSCFENQIEKEKISTMTLLYRSSHYDLIYEEKYFMRNVRFLTLYVNLNENLKVIDSELLKEKEKIKNLSMRNEDLIFFTNNQLEKNIARDSNINSFTKVNSNINSNRFLNINQNMPIKRSEYNEVNNFMQINNQNIQNLDVNNFFQFNNNSVNINDITHSQTKYYDIKNQNSTLDLTNKENLSNTIIIAKDEISNPTIDNIPPINFSRDSNDQEFITISGINKILQQNNNKSIRTNFTCDKCRSLVELYPSNLSSEILNIKLCLTCLSSEVKLKIFNHYRKYISITKKIFMEQLESNDMLKIFNVVFYDNKLNLNNFFYDVHFSCRLIRKEFNYILNEEVKSTICVMCENNLPPDPQNLNCNKGFFKMPCNCFFCTPSCMSSYFNLLLINYRWKRNNLICFCGTQYNTNDLKLLYHFCHTNNFHKSYEKISDIFKEKIKNTCMLCLQSVSVNVKKYNISSVGVNNYSEPNSNFFVSCELKDLQIEKLLHVDKFFHILCHSCFNGEYFQNLLPKGNLTLTRTPKKISFMHKCGVNCMICNDFHELVSYEIKKSNEGFEDRCNIY